MKRAFCLCCPLSGALSAPEQRPDQTSHLVIVCSVHESLDYPISLSQFSIVGNQLTPKMNPSDFQSTVRVYSTEVDQRLLPGHEAHDLGQALVLQVNSEIPVLNKHSLIRNFFEKDSSDNGR